MTTLSADQLRTLLTNAGFKANSQTEDDMVGIAYAESSGDPSKHNDNPKTGDESYGLWQINMIGKMGPTRRKLFGIASNAELFDPQKNANAAYKIYKLQGLDAWSTYKSGEYLKHMDKVGSGETSPSDSSGISISNPLNGIASAIDSVGQNLFKGVANITGIVVALGLLAIGVTILLVESRHTKGFVDHVKKVGKAVNK